jgi:hypothetical protein
VAAPRPREDPERTTIVARQRASAERVSASRRRVHDPSQEWSDMQSALFPALVLAAVAFAVASKIPRAAGSPS